MRPASVFSGITRKMMRLWKRDLKVHAVEGAPYPIGSNRPNSDVEEFVALEFLKVQRSVGMSLPNFKTVLLVQNDSVCIEKLLDPLGSLRYS
jgi:hypothetical protein